MQEPEQSKTSSQHKGSFDRLKDGDSTDAFF
jgi:hypothetical protein